VVGCDWCLIDACVSIYHILFLVQGFVGFAAMQSCGYDMKGDVVNSGLTLTS
jgi:hypothetical protein